MRERPIGLTNRTWILGFASPDKGMHPHPQPFSPVVEKGRGEGSKHQARSVPLPLGEGEGRLLALGFPMPAPTYNPIFFLVTRVGMASRGLSGQ